MIEAEPFKLFSDGYFKHFTFSQKGIMCSYGRYFEHLLQSTVVSNIINLLLI